jgi:hypothetical protein
MVLGSGIGCRPANKALGIVPSPIDTTLRYTSDVMDTLSLHVLVDLDDIALRIVEEDLIPAAHRPLSVI